MVSTITHNVGAARAVCLVINRALKALNFAKLSRACTPTIAAEANAVVDGDAVLGWINEAPRLRTSRISVSGIGIGLIHAGHVAQGRAVSGGALPCRSDDIGARAALGLKAGGGVKPCALAKKVRPALPASAAKLGAVVDGDAGETRLVEELGLLGRGRSRKAGKSDQNGGKER